MILTRRSVTALGGLTAALALTLAAFAAQARAEAVSGEPAAPAVAGVSAGGCPGKQG